MLLPAAKYNPQKYSACSSHYQLLLPLLPPAKVG
jgi:hypothetical protein